MNADVNISNKFCSRDSWVAPGYIASPTSFEENEFVYTLGNGLVNLLTQEVIV